MYHMNPDLPCTNLEWKVCNKESVTGFVCAFCWKRLQFNLSQKLDFSPDSWTFALHGRRKDSACLWRMWKEDSDEPFHSPSMQHLTENTRMLMRVFSLEKDKTQRQHNGETHLQWGSTPGKCGCVCTVCSPPECSAPSGAGNVQGQQNADGKGECCSGGHPLQLQ